MRQGNFWRAAAILVLAVPASAADRGLTDARALAPLFTCRALTDNAARLNCFDKATASLQAAVDKKDVVVSDREQVRETRKTLFGLALPKLPILGGEADDVDQIESTLVTTQVDQYGHFTFRLADGARWRQIDDNPVTGQPKQGDKILVKRAALGSFKLSVNGRPAVRVRREN